jgi:hypothetical protein
VLQVLIELDSLIIRLFNVADSAAEIISRLIECKYVHSFNVKILTEIEGTIPAFAREY